MKKLLCLLLCLVMVVATFAACGKKNDEIESVESTTEVLTESSNSTPYVTQKTKRNFGLFIEGVVEYVLDAKGRLVEMWMLDYETLEREGAYSDELKPWFSFVYGADGKLTECSDEPISYDTQGNATMGEGEEATPLVVEYHANGSVKKIEATKTYGTDSYTTEYDFNGQGQLFSMGTIQTSVEGGNTVTNKSTYNFTYETNKVTLTVTYNDVPVEGMFLTMEFDADGKPVKVVESDGEESDEFGWTWDGDRVASCYEYGTNTQSGSDGQSTSVRYKDETFFTYDGNGNRTRRESKRDGVLREYTVYTYNAANQILSEKEYDNQTVEQYSTVYEYDTKGNLLTKTYAKINGTVTVTDGEGRTVREVIKSEFTSYPGIGDGYSLRETLYDYNVPAGANYSEIRKEKASHYKTDGTFVEADEYWEVSYHTFDKGEYWSYKVDETTGANLSLGEISRDRYGNYLITEGGVPTGIRYYQKYCGDDGRIFYYTAEGVLTYVA